MELATHKIERERLMETKKAAAARNLMQAEHTKAFEALLVKRRALMSDANGALDLLSASVALREELDMQHNRVLTHPDSADHDDIRKLTCGLEELERVVERLRMRCESDGLFVALKELLKANMWKPKQLADQMVKGPSALKVANGKMDEVTGTQLDYFLQRKQITYTQTAFAYFLQKCGSSVKKLEKTPIKAEALVRAFDSIVTPPITVSCPGSGGLGFSTAVKATAEAVSTAGKAGLVGLEKALNAVESATGIDVDGDGDVGQMNSSQNAI